LNRFNFSLTYKTKNKKFIIPVINSVGYQLYGGSEKWATDLYEKLININPGTFVDVGANLGQTLLKIASINKEIPYVGFEPNPLCFFYLKKIIDTNKLKNCNIFPVGLSYENKIVTLLLNNDIASGASILEGFRENKNKYNLRQNIPVMKGDKIFETINETIGVLKADVEGAELEVVKGLRQTILKHKPFVVLEILPVYSLEKENGRYRQERQNELLKQLKELDYQMFRIDESTGALHALTDIEVHGDMNKTNYVFSPVQKMESIKKNFTVIAQ